MPSGRSVRLLLQRFVNRLRQPGLLHFLVEHVGAEDVLQHFRLEVEAVEEMLRGRDGREGLLPDVRCSHPSVNSQKNGDWAEKQPKRLQLECSGRGYRVYKVSGGIGKRFGEFASFYYPVRVIESPGGDFAV